MTWRGMRFGLAALLLGTSLVTAGSPAEAADDVQRGFESHWLRIQDGTLFMKVQAETRPGAAPLLSVTIYESNGNPRMLATRRITLSHAARFEVDPDLMGATLDPTRAQMGDHGEIDMTWVSTCADLETCDKRYKSGYFEGTFRFEVVLGSRHVEVQRSQLPGNLRPSALEANDACRYYGRQFWGTVDRARFITHPLGDVVVIHAEKRGTDSPSGWRTDLEVESRLPGDHMFLDDTQEHGFLRGRPGAFIRHASTYEAPSPGEDGPWTACTSYGQEAGTISRSSQGTFTPAGGGDGLEVQWINGRSSHLVGDGITAGQTRWEPNPP